MAVDDDNPTITCTSDIQQTVNCGIPSFVVFFPASATDDCPGVPSIQYTARGATEFTSQTTNFRHLNVGTSIITAKTTDGSGRTSSCETLVSITEGKSCELYLHQ